MHFSTADGREWDVADMCAYCNMSTGGQHESHCPILKQQMREGYQEMSEINLKFAEEWFPVSLETWPPFKKLDKSQGTFTLSHHTCS